MKENNETSVKRFIRVPDVLNRVGFSRTTLYERIKEGNFPDRVKIGPRCVALSKVRLMNGLKRLFETHARTQHKNRNKISCRTDICSLRASYYPKQ